MNVATKLAAVTLVVATSFTTAACSSTSGQPNTTAGPTAAAAPAAGAALGPADFAAALKRPATLLLDVRTPAEFATGHLPGATLIDFEAADFAAKVAQLDKSKTYAIYCRSGNRTGQAKQVMQGLGLTVFDLGGGINAWTAAGGNTVKG